MKLAITTPTGKIGSKLTDELLSRGGHELILLTRNRSKVAAAVERGAKVFEGKLEDRAFFRRATTGVDALFFVLPIDSRSKELGRDCSSMLDSAVAAIRDNGIPRVVFVSSLGAHLDSGTGPILILRDAERKLRDAAPNLTVLRPVFFMDQFMGWMKDIAEERAFFLPFPESTKIPMIATRDVATYAADVLTDKTWTGRRILPLHGPREYSFSDAARILGRKLGMEVRHVQVEPDEAGRRLRDRGWSDDAVKRSLEMHRAIAQGTLRDEFPKEKWTTRPTTFEEFVTHDFVPAFEGIAAVGAGS